MNKPQHHPKDVPEHIILNNIADFAWYAVNVIDDDDHPPWSYSIGFYDTWNYPEIITIEIAALPKLPFLPRSPLSQQSSLREPIQGSPVAAFAGRAPRNRHPI